MAFNLPFKAIIQTILLACLIFIFFSGNAQEKPTQVYFPYTVTLKTGIILTPDQLQIVNRDKEDAHLLLDNEQRVAFRVVYSYTTYNEYHLIQKMGDHGYVDMLRIEDGKLQVYEFYRNDYSPYFGGGVNKRNHQYYLVDSELKTLSSQNLKKDVIDHQPSLAKIKEITRGNILKTLMFGAGSVLVAIGLSQMYQPSPTGGYQEFNFELNPPFLGGAGLLAFPSFAFKKKKYSLLDLVRDYNDAFPSEAQ